MAREKHTGRLFARSGVWYMRWRHGGEEVTRTTGIRVDYPELASDPKACAKAKADAKAKAEAMLYERTEVFRLTDRRNALSLVKHQLQTVDEEIKDRLEGIRRSATLGELADMFERSSLRRDTSAAQLKEYRRYCESVAAFFGPDQFIAAVTVAHAERYAESLKDLNLSPNRHNKYLNGLGLVWRTIGDSVGAADNPWEKLPRRKLDTSVRRALTEDETKRLLATATGEMRVLVAVGLYTGLRLGDAVHLTRDSVKDNVLFVVTGKTGARVAVPLHPTLRRMLAGCPECGAITPGLARVYDRSSSGVVRKVKRLFERCGIATSAKPVKGVPDKAGKKEKGKKRGPLSRPLAGFHSLRHTFVSRCTAAGISPAVVQALVGHSNARMTEHYTHLRNADFLREFAKMK